MDLDYPTLANGRYQIEQCIGTGGMAAVFKCFDQNLKVSRAVKVLRPEMFARESIRNRFATEAQAMASLQHPNIVSVYDHGNDGAVVFIVMEYLPHNSLQQYLEHRGPLNRAQAIDVCLDVARALQNAHEQGIIHRDIKPDNILLSPKGAKLSDFGLARIDSDTTRATKTQAIMGSFPFMAPEQRLSAKKTNHQSDIYSLCASLFVMLTQEDPSELFDPDERTHLLANIEGPLAQIISRGCASTLAERYADVSELIAELESAQPESDPDAAALRLLEEAESATPNAAEITELKSVWSQYTSGSNETSQAEATPSVETIHFHDEWEDSDEPQEEPHHDTLGEPQSAAPSPQRRPAWLIPLVLTLLLGGAATWVASQDGLPGATSATDVEEIKPPNWNYAGIFLLQNPTDPADQEAFVTARRALLNGEYPMAERLLAPLLESHPKEPAAHSLSTLIHFFRGRISLTAEGSRRAASASRDLESPLGELLELSDRSWREFDQAELLLTKWEKLRFTQPDPMAELLYLVSARYILGPEGFLEKIRLAREAHPDWVVLVSLEVFALQQLVAHEEALDVLVETIPRFPTATGLLLAKGEMEYELGNLDSAELDMKKVLVLDANLTQARAILAGIYAQQDKEAERLEQMLIALGDTTALLDQMSFLEDHAQAMANVGRLSKAESLWRFCIDTGKEAGDANRRLDCANQALDALQWLRPATEWDSWIATMKETLSEPGFEPDLQMFYSFRLLWTQAIQHVRTGNLREAKAILEQFEALENTDLPLGLQPYFVNELRFEIALANEDTDKLTNMLESYRSEAQVGSTLRCMFAYREARAATALQDKASLERAARTIVNQECVMDSTERGIFLAHARLWLAKLALDSGENDNARSLLEGFRQDWPAADEDLGLTQLASELEERL